eukprot:3326479-Amphidinium_carterae.1
MQDCAATFAWVPGHLSDWGHSLRIPRCRKVLLDAGAGAAWQYSARGMKPLGSSEGAPMSQATKSTMQSVVQSDYHS